MRAMLIALAVLAGAGLLGVAATRGAFAARDATAKIAQIDPCPRAQPVPDALRLPPPDQIPPGEPTAIEQKMLRYLYGDDPNHVPSNSPNLYPYRRLGWCVDKYVRDTGPYVHGQYTGRIPRCASTTRPKRWHGCAADGAASPPTVR